jgi:hypothetical protein
MLQSTTSSSTSPREADSWAQGLIDVLQRQQEMVRELRGMAQEQSGFIAAGRTDALLGVLGRRQQLLDRFLATQDELVSFTANLDHQLQAVDAPRRDMIRTLLDEIGEQLTQVMQADEHDQSALQASRDKTGEEMAELGHARHARSAYIRSAPAASRFADRQG